MTIRFCKMCGDWHDLAEPWPMECVVINKKRSDLPSPGIISDTMEGGVQSQLDGKIYSSKSALRRTYKAAGMVEVGNDPARHKPFVRQKIDRKKLRDDIQRAEARVNRGERSIKK